jgi:phosphoserine phosphatase
MPNVQLFDVDGTLTRSEKDLPATISIYQTFAFWPLLSYRLSKLPVHLRTEIELWENTMKGEPDPDGSSFRMMARTVSEFLRFPLQQSEMIACAREITQNFLLCNIVRLEAIKYICECLEKGIICILTTGSYLDGLRGFVEVLQNKHLLPRSPNLILNGAEIDWSNQTLLWANTGAYKTTKVRQTLKDLGITDYRITAAFGDDPYINDKGILEMAECSFVIKCKKNEVAPFNQRFKHCSWEEFFVTYKERILNGIPIYG